MKKLLVYILALTMILAITGCGSSADSADTTASGEPVETAESIAGAGEEGGMQESGESPAGGEAAEAAEGDEGADPEGADAAEDAEGDAAEDGEGEAEEDAESDESGETVEVVESQTGEEPYQDGEEAEGEDGSAEGTEEGAETPVNDGKLVLAAASTLRVILDEQLIPQFMEEHPGIRVETVYDTSENLKNQIESGAAFDLFFCGGKKPMAALQEEGLVIEGSVHALMTNELSFVVPRDSRLGIITVADLEKAGSIAIGDPIYMPVGEYTIDTLKEQELWDMVKEKDVYLAATVDELLGMLIDGTADCGFVYQNDAVMQAEKIHIVEGLAPTTYRLGILASTGRQENATAFVDFMSSDSVLAQLVANGFTLPES